MSLLQRARSNDQEAWHQIVHLYGPLVHKWCHRSNLKDDDLADVFQETFRSVATHLKTFSPAKDAGSFRSWLRTICRTDLSNGFVERICRTDLSNESGGPFQETESATGGTGRNGCQSMDELSG